MMVSQYDLLLNENNIPSLRSTNEFLITDGLNMPHEIARFMKDNFHMENKAEEYAYLLCFNHALTPLGIFELSHGTVGFSIISTREIMIRALSCGATGIVLVHNHPAGTTKPSASDLKTEKELNKVCKLMQIEFLDSIIIGRNSYRSMHSDQGK